MQCFEGLELDLKIRVINLIGLQNENNVPKILCHPQLWL